MATSSSCTSGGGERVRPAAVLRLRVRRPVGLRDPGVGDRAAPRGHAEPGRDEGVRPHDGGAAAVPARRARRVRRAGAAHDRGDGRGCGRGRERPGDRVARGRRRRSSTSATRERTSGSSRCATGSRNPLPRGAEGGPVGRHVLTHTDVRRRCEGSAPRSASGCWRSAERCSSCRSIRP